MTLCLPNLPRQPGRHLPELARAALLLDLDGTLLDIAPAPDQVVVPADLPAHLLSARWAVGHALAIVSGRPIDQVDALLPDLPYAVAGEHGSIIRHAPDEDVEYAPLPTAPKTWVTQAESWAAATPGVLFEQKKRGFVLHYRAAPSAGPALENNLRGLLAEQTEFVLLPALMAWEVRPIGADKGTAVHALMRRTPFAGRVPIFIGDDVTDEDGMRACVTYGGMGLRVAEAFGGPADVRAWLGRI